ncbi:family 16 glycosylhydrolase [Shewanella donghaensis]|uniref:family 16 glycosylhydrolase n=1 Tax=Shewanella donghaensis TaxID=238836 RepID=UPI001182F736|nr:family 16 glycosylhydrolase [Shewanella donghaensis]
MKPNFAKSALFLLIAQSLTACQNDGTAKQNTAANTEMATVEQVMPYSDPKNNGGWVLNTEISDEFNGDVIDQEKWFVQGANDEYYIWKGRAPSQFAPHNVILENGILKLQSQWEPDFEFANENYADGKVDAKYGQLADGSPMPITTAAIVSNKRFLNGYMEIRSKAVNAAMTSAFWAIGYQSELDIFEQIGNPKIIGDIKPDQSKSTVHDWSPPAKRPTRVFHHKENLPYRVADEFHIYAAEWGEDYLNMYLDGKLLERFTQKELGDRWVLNNPLEIWLDSEIFAWLGMPNKDELPASFEIDYMRVWQKPTPQLLDRAFFGFEGPILFQENKRPLTLVPENSQNNDYQQFWDIDTESAKFAAITTERRISGLRSLKISAAKADAAQAIVATAPKATVKLAAGDYTFSMRLWVDTTNSLKELNVTLSDELNSQFGFKLKPFNLSHIDHAHKAQWITVSQDVTLSKAVPAGAQLALIAQPKDIEKDVALVFVDDISMVAK